MPDSAPVAPQPPPPPPGMTQPIGQIPPQAPQEPPKTR